MSCIRRLPFLGAPDCYIVSFVACIIDCADVLANLLYLSRSETKSQIGLWN